MIRNLKMLGLAISAMLVFGAMASVATAAEFHASSAPVELHAEQPAEFNDVFTTDAGTVTCKTATYTGSQAATTTTTASANPSYTECTGTFGVSVTVDVNGCGYVFHTSPASADVECASGKQIEVTAPGCVVTVGKQTGLNGVSFESNAGNSDVTVKVKSTNIDYTEHNKGFFPTCKSNTVTTSDGKYTGEATVTGSAGGKAVNVWYT